LARRFAGLIVNESHVKIFEGLGLLWRKDFVDGAGVAVYFGSTVGIMGTGDFQVFNGVFTFVENGEVSFQNRYFGFAQFETQVN
jgi:hypothetical protein